MEVRFCLLVLSFGVLFSLRPAMSAQHDYAKALSKTLLFFEAQRSGFLPENQRVQWRGDSGLSDGKIDGVDLVGGYYDAGDNVKFGLPMAFTITIMSWSLIEYGNEIASAGELENAVGAVKWGTDYLIKAHPRPDVLYGEVGDGNTDHDCWQRPEEMTTSRAAYKIDKNHPGSDLAGETAAAMAAAAIVFRRYNASYSSQLLEHSEQLFEFADKYRGKYDSSITVAQKYYRSVSGYEDELLWAAAWLYKATNKEHYLDYLGYNGDAFGGTTWAITEFGWDVKYAGVQTLVSQLLMAGKGEKHRAIFEKYQEKAEMFMCGTLGKGNPSDNVQRTPGGLIFKQRWNNMQFVTTASFLTTLYSDYLTSAHKSLDCPQALVLPSQLLSFAKSQVDYILGDNPRATSYMVGYGKAFPQQVHHRASSIISYKVDHSFISCKGGYATWFNREGSDPNPLTGAIVGGPGAYDNFADQRDNYEQTEPTTYNSAPLLGVLARLHSDPRNYKKQFLSPAKLPALKPAATTPTPAAKPAVDPISEPTGSINHPLAITQRMTTSWNYNQKTYYRYSTTITNKSSKSLKHLKIKITKLYGPLWGLSKLAESNSVYQFPPWRNSLAGGESLEFVYIHSGSPAEVSVTSYLLV